MELRQLGYFVKAAEMLHFTEAAAALYVTQSTLSQQIRQLENELGMPLFDRIGKQVRLTEAGGVFLLHARQILLDVEKGKQAIEDLQQMLTGELRIGVTYAFTSMLLPALKSFTAKYPGIRIFIDYGTTDDLERKLRSSELDFALVFHQDQVPGDFDKQRLFTAKVVLAVSRKHKLATLSHINLKSLHGMEIVLAASGFSSRDFLDEVLKKHNVIPDIKIELNDVHALLSLVEQGHWPTLLNEQALTGWKNLVAVPIEDRELLRYAYVLWQKGTYRKKAADLFVESLGLLAKT
ncbi:MAG TPA: LysR substrate-binding domain-containing protein [Chitinophaga sp.]|uniref:LysR substrate-binding domain-containing protein n=1 Tax=Chitinophaga sp. TaxID=1869181 RepID=UPI002C93D437|nr:LysR substrate-binding domain-containing protein [Chitinophaga sp.]HVI44966.1 LysR substrate-binding domain-containing protein [Chitinophaga sp.]